MLKLHAFSPAFGLPSPSPFAIKTEVQLIMLDIPYQLEFDKPPNGPKGKLPYINDHGTIVADSTFIRIYLEEKYAIDLDRDLDQQQRALAWTIEKMVEDHLFWAMVHSRWAIEENFINGPSHFYDPLPEPMQNQVRDQTRRNVLGYLHGQGFGRHSIEEIGILAERSLKSLSILLGNKPYFMGDHPCGADASIFGQIASVLSPQFNSPVREAARSHQNLISYTQRMMEKYYPHFLA